LQEGGELLRGGLVRVRVEVVGRGVPREHAVVWASALPQTLDAACGDERKARRSGASNTEQAGEDDGDRGERVVLGYLTAGWYDSWQGKGVGVGFLSTAALSTAFPVASVPFKVHVRNTSSSGSMGCCAFICP
jgi:hypothetical protein